METIRVGNVNQQIQLPDSCPICHRHIVPKKVAESVTLKSIVQVVFKCSSEKCFELFIAYYTFNLTGTHAVIKLFDTKPRTVELRDFPLEITSLSPNFVEIYNQSKFAETNDLDQVCGPGYRKSLEFLIKDYLISLAVYPEDEIKGKFLGKCIELIKDDRIRLCSERATWLGNDETHYVRKWEQKDISNLKELIDLTVYWLSMELITKRYTAEMPAHHKN